jgi:RNA polymerase sigma-70 factor (ECF subfamily)
VKGDRSVSRHPTVDVDGSTTCRKLLCVGPSQPVEQAEQAMRAACLAGDYDGATTTALREYGPELFGFLISMNRDYDVASEAFGMFSEKLWHSMRRFEWECSLRAWCYRLARNAAIDLHRGGGGAGVRRKGHVGLSSAPEVMEVAAQVRTTTMSALRTENRSALERLRDELSEEDRALLVLRVDRELEWREVAMVLAASSGRAERIADEESLKRETARLRKRLQLVVERLRSLAKERKLI